MPVDIPTDADLLLHQTQGRAGLDYAAELYRRLVAARDTGLKYAIDEAEENYAGIISMNRNRIVVLDGGLVSTAMPSAAVENPLPMNPQSVVFPEHEPAMTEPVSHRINYPMPEKRTTFGKRDRTKNDHSNGPVQAVNATAGQPEPQEEPA